jgi:hypothetical protein
MSQRDPAEAPVLAECAWCRGEIYVGDEVKRIDDGGGYVHDGWGTDCAENYAAERVYDAEGIVNERGEIE